MLFQLMEVVAVEMVEEQQVSLQQEVASVCEKATTPVVIPTGKPLAKVTTVVPWGQGHNNRSM